MGRYKRSKRVAALIAAAFLASAWGCTPFFGPVTGVLGMAAWADTDSAITIATPEDFKEFAWQCRFDSYSVGKVFQLTADIDLTGSACPPVPSFGGTFLGNGHVIRGWSYEAPGSDVALFRFVEPGGLVEGLTIEASMDPEGTRERVGGLAGTNRGRLKDCVVTGAIHGKKGTGGIAGFNEPSGLIEGCENRALVAGLENTGGIVGENEGIVENCVNRGSVNITDVAEGEEDSMSTDLQMGGRLLEAEKVYHTGGIAGRSKGILKGCVNEADVGYPHAGYNTGGIVGMQNGCVSQCTNRGAVRGRKDTGGIVGQFEPYIQVNYEEDTLQQVQNQMDTLIDQMDALGGLLGGTGDETLAVVDGLRGSLKQIRSSIQGDKQFYFDNTKNFSSDLDESLDRLKESVDQMDLQIETGSLGAALRSIRNGDRYLAQLREELKDAIIKDPARAKQILDEMQRTAASMAETARRIPKSVEEDLEDTQDNLNAQLDQIGDRSEDTMNLVKDNKNRLFDDLEQTDSGYQSQFDTVGAQLDALYDTLDGANVQIQDQMQAIRGQVRQIHVTIEGGVERAQEWKDKELVDDVSDAEADDMGSGRVLNCVNEGMVASDNNVGGVVGIIGLELSKDPEQDVDVSGDTSLRIDRTSRAAVQGSVNVGKVTSQNHYAGGIVGRADAGAIIRGQNYGDIEAIDGDYAGGIAGSSTGVVRGGYSLCRVAGHNYIGGIVGKGEDMKDNCAVVSLDGEPGEYRGAVAGLAEGDVVSGNRFVWDGHAAVNGVTYQSQASVLSYEELLAREGTPEAFRLLKVRFVADDVLVKEVEIPYGQPVPEEEIPAVPEKEGCYGRWDREGLDGVKRYLTVNAAYRPWTTTIASREADEQGLSRLLLEGDFHPQTTVDLESWDTGQEQVPGYRVRGAFRFSVGSPMGKTWGEKLRVRLLTGDLKLRRPAAIAIGDGQSYEVVESWQDGSYQLFAAQEGDTILLLEKSWNPYPTLSFAAIVAAVLCIIWKRRKKGSPSAP